MNGAIRVGLAVIALVAVYAYTMSSDTATLAKDTREADISRRLLKLDYVEAANIRECMAKFGTTENVSASIKGQILECRTKRGHLIGAL
jgi:hypothetical protein